MTTSYGKKKVSEEIAPMLGKIENPIVQNHYIHKTAELLSISESAIEESIRRTARTKDQIRYTPKEEVVALDTRASREDKFEVYLLALLLQGRTVDLFEDLQDAELLPEFGNPVVHQIIDRLVSSLSSPEGEPEGVRVFLVKDFADALPPELLPVFDEAFLWDLSDFLDNDELYSKEWLKTLREFKKMMLHRKIQDLTKRGASEELPQKEANEIQKQLRSYTNALKDMEKPS